MSKKKTNPHRGSSLDDFLEEEGILEEATAKAAKKARKRAAKAERKQAGSGVRGSTQEQPRLTDSTNIDTLLP